MTFGVKQSSYEAVFYVSRTKVLKEMLYSEFEAVLDGVVTEPDYKDESCYAVYLKIDVRLNILAAVFFYIDFDNSGNADRRWNLPLLQMAESAAVGADLNGQGVKICCRSRCRVATQQEKLWEPDLSESGAMLNMLASSVKANRLGLLVDATQTSTVNEPAQLGGQSSQQANQAQMATGEAYEQAVVSQQRHEGELKRLTDNIQKQRLYISSLKGRQEEALQNMRAQQAREKQVLLLQVEEAGSALEALRARNQEVQNELREAHEQMATQRAEFENQISAGVNQQGVDFTVLQKQFRRELQQKLIEQTSELKAQLDMRDVEAHYRDEQIKHLKEQLRETAAMAAAHAAGAGSGSAGEKASLREAVMELESHGVNFVLTLPAVRPITIPASDVDGFCQDPEAFVARRLGMETTIYTDWLRHAKNPVCSASITDDCCCGVRLDIVHPREYVPDFSRFCKEHQPGNINQSRALG